jgi:hypothetical protein
VGEDFIEDRSGMRVFPPWAAPARGDGLQSRRIVDLKVWGP